MNRIKQLLLLAILSLSAVQASKAYFVECMNQVTDETFEPDSSAANKDEAAKRYAASYCRLNGGGGVAYLYKKEGGNLICQFEGCAPKPK
jgi:hypothetical protein